MAMMIVCFLSIRSMHENKECDFVIEDVIVLRAKVAIVMSTVIKTVLTIQS